MSEMGKLLAEAAAARLLFEVTEVDIDVDLYELWPLLLPAMALALEGCPVVGCEADDIDEVHEEYDEVEDKVEDSKVVTAPPLMRWCCCCCWWNCIDSIEVAPAVEATDCKEVDIDEGEWLETIEFDGGVTSGENSNNLDKFVDDIRS